MSHTGKKRLRDRLFNENPYCPICKVKMISPVELPIDKHGHIKHFPDNTVVLKRRHGKYDALDRLNNRKPSAIMCRKCETAMSKERQAEVDKEILRLRSKPVKKLTKW